MYELQRTNPDYVVYIPKGPATGKRDGANHVVTVLPGLKPNSFVAFWLQDSAEQAPDSHYVCARSDDNGKTWTEPITIAGQNFDPQTGRDRCSFGTAFRNAKGRIYILLNHYSGYADPHENGFLYVTYTDDDGQTFGPQVQAEFKKFPELENDDPKVPPTMIAFQPPLKISSGKYVGGITRYASLTKFPRRPHWTDEESVCSMYVIENADDNPAPQDLKFTWTTCLKAPSRNNPTWSVAQEPAIVELPDGRLFCAFRTNFGSPWYALSNDGGYTWGETEVLRYGDGKPAMLHPLSPCPIYSDRRGHFYMFIHNHDGHFGPWGPKDTEHHRRPIYLVRGVFTPDAHQPLTFGEPEMFFDDDGIPLGYQYKRADLALYASMTHVNGQSILWYPDRKHFICGKIIREK